MYSTKKKIHKISKILLLVLCFVYILISPSLGQPSLILTIQNSLPSVVNISSEIISAFKSPRASAAIDKKTGRLIVVRNVKAASYKRQGAGVIVNSNGLIVTNAHTITKSSKITVTLHDGKVIPARTVWVAADKDLALIKIDPPYPLRPISFADSQNVRLGDEIVTVGNSEFLKQTISGGKIIGLGSVKKSFVNKNTDLLHVSINLYKGDSGGPLFDKKGRLIGLMVAGQKQRDHSSFAIPSNKIMEQILKHKK